MKTIDYYVQKSNSIIDSYYEVEILKEKLYFGKEEIGFFLNNKAMYKLMHPIKLVKTQVKKMRIKKVEKEFDTFMDSNILQYLEEESGELQTDLENAAFYYKPKFARKLAKKLQLRL